MMNGIHLDFDCLSHVFQASRSHLQGEENLKGASRHDPGYASGKRPFSARVRRGCQGIDTQVSHEQTMSVRWILPVLKAIPLTR